jgi:hypothetical protein
MSDAASTAGRWPERLPVGSFRVMRPRRNYDRTIPFYRDLIGLPVLETFQASYGEDGTIFGLPDSSTQSGDCPCTGARRAGKPVRPAGVLPNR